MCIFVAQGFVTVFFFYRDLSGSLSTSGAPCGVRNEATACLVCRRDKFDITSYLNDIGVFLSLKHSFSFNREDKHRDQAHWVEQRGEGIDGSGGQKEAIPQSFFPTPAPILGERVFPPTVPEPRRARAVGERPGNDGATDQKLVSKPEIPETTP